MDVSLDGTSRTRRRSPCRSTCQPPRPTARSVTTASRFCSSRECSWPHSDPQRLVTVVLQRYRPATTSTDGDRQHGHAERQLPQGRRDRRVTTTRRRGHADQVTYTPEHPPPRPPAAPAERRRVQAPPAAGASRSISRGEVENTPPAGAEVRDRHRMHEEYGRHHPRAAPRRRWSSASTETKPSTARHSDGPDSAPRGERCQSTRAPHP